MWFRPFSAKPHSSAHSARVRDVPARDIPVAFHCISESATYSLRQAHAHTWLSLGICDLLSMPIYTLIFIINSLVVSANTLAVPYQPEPTVTLNPHWHPSLSPSHARFSRDNISHGIMTFPWMRSQNDTWNLHQRAPTSTEDALEGAPTPAPTAPGSSLTTVYIDSETDFSLLLPSKSGGTFAPQLLIPAADASSQKWFQTPSQTVKRTVRQITEEDAIISFLKDLSLDRRSTRQMMVVTFKFVPWNFFIFCKYREKLICQVTGCFDSSLFPFASNDKGGQFDVRFPNGAQCTFGGYGASFIELFVSLSFWYTLTYLLVNRVEPAGSRFCLRCCKEANDQNNCNSHHDNDGCINAIPGVYTFGNVDCSWINWRHGLDDLLMHIIYIIHKLHLYMLSN